MAGIEVALGEHVDRKKIIQICIKDLKRFFPKAHVYKENELIVEPKNNIYFRIDNIKNELEFKCKVLEWLSRPGHKGLSKWWQIRIRNGMNRFLGTSFTVEDLNTVYCKLGNCCNRSLTMKFVTSGYDLSVLCDDQNAC